MTTYLGKSCSFGLPRVSLVNCCQFMYLVISFWFWGQDVESDCVSFWSLLIFLLRKIAGKSIFRNNSERFNIIRYKRLGYNLDIKLQTACLVDNPITVDSHTFLFNCTAADSMAASSFSFTSGLGPDAMSLAWPAVVQLVVSGNVCMISQEYSSLFNHSD